MSALETRRRYFASRHDKCSADTPVSADALAYHSCEHCDKIQIVLSSDWPNKRFHDLLPVDSAIEAASTGCSWYEWILDHLCRSKQPIESFDRVDIKLHLVYKRHSKYEISEVQVLICNPTYSWPCGEFEVFAESNDPASRWISSRPSNLMVGSENSFRQALKWLHECHTSHAECRISSTTCPSRLIDVSTRSGSDRVRIVTQESEHTYFPKYAALSYCWGASQSLTTSMLTLPAHMDMLSISELPKTIQDAIIVTRTLELPFLWVDSLCIVQDDPQDVAREISKMADYFENAYVTISAATAKGCTEGFLEPRTASLYSSGPIKFSFQGPGDPIGQISLVTHKLAPKEPIDSRAWTLQETLLSTRALTYGAQNLRWSCRQRTCSDGGREFRRPTDEMRIAWSNTSSLVPKSTRFRALLGNEAFDRVGWHQLISAYTERHLTVSGDKLLAISGIAQKYRRYRYQERDGLSKEQTPPDDYIAGLWRSDLPYHLVWTTTFNKRDDWHLSVRRAKDYRAPSWSWAAVEGSISFYNCMQAVLQRDEMEVTKVVDCHVELANPEVPYGAVKNGFLTLDGLMIPATAANVPGPFYKIDMLPDTRDDQEIMEDIRNGTLQAWCFQIVPRSRSLSKTVINDTPYGLVLVRNDSDSYRRIGFFRSRPTPHKPVQRVPFAPSPAAEDPFSSSKCWYFMDAKRREVTIV